MRKRNYKGRCEKRKISKCKEILKTYDALQSACADILEADEEITSIRCNVLLEGLSIGEYTSDFVCQTASGGLRVCECVFRKHLTKPMTQKLLDASREYWLKRGAEWRLVIDADK